MECAGHLPNLDICVQQHGLGSLGHNPDAPGVAEMLIGAFDVHADER